MKKIFVLLLLALMGTAAACGSSGSSGQTDVPVIPTDPVIAVVNPSEAKVGEEIQIAGTGFGDAQGSSTVGIRTLCENSIKQKTTKGDSYA